MADVSRDGKARRVLTAEGVMLVHSTRRPYRQTAWMGGQPGYKVHDRKQ